jgi:hypothetical protein
MERVFLQARAEAVRVLDCADVPAKRSMLQRSEIGRRFA